MFNTIKGNFTSRLAELGENNCNPVYCWGKMAGIPYQNSKFLAVFCYGNLYQPCFFVPVNRKQIGCTWGCT